MGYAIKLPQFEGPFDLLLFFIERDELDIYDIPISKITQDFLAYVHEMQTLNIELASEFILVASTLMRVKAKTLLPRKELDEEGKEIDPREELVQQLLEYKRFKAVLKDLEQLEQTRALQQKRGNIQNDLLAITQEYSTEMELMDLNLFNLMNVFQRAITKMEERNKKVEHKVIRYPYTIKGQKEFLKTKIKKGKETAFEKIFEELQDRVHAIFTFLALLELIQLKVFSIKTGIGMNNFWVRAV